MIELAQTIIGDEHFIEVLVNSSLEICEKRDIKGLDEKTQAGEIRNFTGISDSYEVPVDAFVVNTEINSIEEASTILYNFVLLKILFLP